MVLAILHFFWGWMIDLYAMAKVLGSSFYFSHIKIDPEMWSFFFFHCTDISVTKICSSYICAYGSVAISDISVAENTSASCSAVFVNIVTSCSHWASFENVAVHFWCKSRFWINVIKSEASAPAPVSSTWHPWLQLRGVLWVKASSASVASSRREEDGGDMWEVYCLENQAGWASADWYVSVFGTLNTRVFRPKPAIKY